MRLIDIDVLKNDIKTNGEELTLFRDKLFNLIDKQPTVDPVKHGKWVHPKKSVVMNNFFCSECNHEEISHREAGRRYGEVHYADENGDFYLPPRMNYCSNCGARMDGDK